MNESDLNIIDLNIGAKVHCKDGEAGKLVKVVVDPESLRVTDLIVEAGFLLKRARVFPIRKVEYAGDKDIYLSIRSDELNGYPEYHEKEYERPATEWEHPHYKIDYVLFPGHNFEYAPAPVVKEKVRQGISSELEVVKEGTPINNLGGTIGKLDHVVADSSTKSITHLVIQRGTLSPERINIPIYFVKRVGEDGILVDITNEELDQLAQDTLGA